MQSMGLLLLRLEISSRHELHFINNKLSMLQEPRLHLNKKGESFERSNPGADADLHHRLMQSMGLHLLGLENSLRHELHSINNEQSMLQEPRLHLSK